MTETMELQTQPIEQRSPTAMEAIQRAEASMAIHTAKQYPRDTAIALRNATQLVTFSKEAAEATHYCLPRGGKMITGPSIRLAEALASSWGNLRIQTVVKEIGEEAVVVCAMGHDLESNTAISVDVRRRITDKRGHRYNEDMITVTCNAAASIAYRNVVLRLIPQAVWQSVYNAALKKFRDGDEPIETRRKRALSWFADRGISSKQILQKLGLAKEDDIVKDHIVTLQGIKNAIVDGDITMSTAFGNGTEGKATKATPPPPPPQPVPVTPVKESSIPVPPPPPPAPATKEEPEAEPEPEPVAETQAVPETPAVPTPPADAEEDHRVSVTSSAQAEVKQPSPPSNGTEQLWSELKAKREQIDKTQFAWCKEQCGIERVRQGMPRDKMELLMGYIDQCIERNKADG